jgi:hypothetical protein
MCGSVLVFATCELGTWSVLLEKDEEQMKIEMQIIEDKILS